MATPLQTGRGTLRSLSVTQYALTALTLAFLVTLLAFVDVLAKGEYIALRRKLNLKVITCLLYLQAGERDDITAQQQVFAAERLMGTPTAKVTRRIVPGGHVGLFMGLAT